MPIQFIWNLIDLLVQGMKWGSLRDSLKSLVSITSAFVAALVLITSDLWPKRLDGQCLRVNTHPIIHNMDY